MRHAKELRWVGSSYDDLLKFPREVRRTAGFELGTRDKEIAEARYRSIVNARTRK